MFGLALGQPGLAVAGGWLLNPSIDPVGVDDFDAPSLFDLPNDVDQADAPVDRPSMRILSARVQAEQLGPTINAPSYGSQEVGIAGRTTGF